MKKLLKACSAISLLGAMLFAAGCGDNSEGNVTKNPVYNAKVYYKKDGKYLQTDRSLGLKTASPLTHTTNPTGRYPVIEGYEVETEGGKYVDPVNPAVAKDAPQLKAPAGARNVTAITTLIANAPAAERAAVIAKVEALGIKFDDPLNNNAAGSSSLVAAKINEVVGAVLGTLSNPAAPTAADLNKLTNFATALFNNVSATTKTDTEIAAAITTAVTAAAITLPTNTITQIVAAVQPGPAPIVTVSGTGATGSQGATK